MRFAPTEDQTLLQRGVADALRKLVSLDDARAAFHGAERSRERLAALGELGVFGVLVPEAEGGLGLGAVELCLVLEEAGRHLLPEPLLEMAAIVAPAVAECASATARADWLPRLCSGEATAGVGLVPGAPIAEATADVLLVAHENALFLAPRAHLDLRRETSVDGARRLATLSGAPPVDTRIAEGDDAHRAIARASTRGALAAAAELVGLSRRMLDDAVEHVKVRKQFGAPIGSFQAVKHHLADALTAIEMARPLVLAAAWSVDAGEPDAEARVSMAKARTSDAASLVAKKALQCHGAIGYSFEHHLHLAMKRAWALSRAFGDAAEHRARVARLILDGEKRV